MAKAPIPTSTVTTKKTRQNIRLQSEMQTNQRRSVGVTTATLATSVIYRSTDPTFPSPVTTLQSKCLILNGPDWPGVI